MKVNTLRIPCKDLAESEAFYSNILGLTKAYGSQEQGFVGYHLENAKLMIETEAEGEFESGRYLGFSIEVDDIGEFYRRISGKGGKFTGPPEKQVWGGIMTHLEDCSGNSFSVIQAGDGA